VQRIKSNRTIKIDGSLLEHLNDEAIIIVNITILGPKELETDWWVNIDPRCFIDNHNNSGKSLQMIHSFNIAVAPTMEYLISKNHNKKFTLIFPAIPVD
jgi:hypothetical protein